MEDSSSPIPPVELPVAPDAQPAPVVEELPAAVMTPVEPATFNQLMRRANAVSSGRMRVFFGLAVLQALVIALQQAIPMAVLAVGGAAFLINPLAGLGALALGAVLFVFAGVLTSWVGAAWINAIVFADARIGLKDALKRGWKQTLSFVWIAFLMQLVVMGGFLLMYPGIVWMVSFLFVPIIIVAEGLKGRDALVRSRQLVIGDWWSVLLRLILLEILAAISIVVAMIPIAIVMGIVEAVWKNNPWANMVTGFLGAFAVGMFVMPRVLGFILGMYEDMRRRKDANPAPLPKHKTYFTIAAVAGLLIVPLLLAYPAWRYYQYTQFTKAFSRQDMSGSFTLDEPISFSNFEEDETASATKTPSFSSDDDNDGLIYMFEENTDPANPDSDGDGLSDGDEYDVFSTRPNMADSDGDGYADGVELRGGFDPRNSSGGKLTEADIKRFADAASARDGFHEPTRTTFTGSAMWDPYLTSGGR